VGGRRAFVGVVAVVAASVVGGVTPVDARQPPRCETQDGSVRVDPAASPATITVADETTGLSVEVVVSIDGATFSVEASDAGSATVAGGHVGDAVTRLIGRTHEAPDDRAIDDESRSRHLIAALRVDRRTDRQADSRPDGDAHSDRTAADQGADQNPGSSAQRQPGARELHAPPASLICIGHDNLQPRTPRASPTHWTVGDHGDRPHRLDRICFARLACRRALPRPTQPKCHRPPDRRQIVR
jgi:hypothetical protein